MKLRVASYFVCVCWMISCRSSLFLVTDVLFGRVGTGGVESDEREIQERASEMHRLPTSYPNNLSIFGLAGSGMRSCAPNKSMDAISSVGDCYNL